MKLFSLLFAIMFLVSCQHEIVPVSEENKNLPGVRFSMPEPYLMVAEKPVIIDGLEETMTTKDGPKKIIERMELPDKQLVASIIYLPNPHKEYLIKNAKPSEIYLKDGWRFEGFDSYQLNNDEKQIKSLLELLTGTKDLTPGVYRFIRDQNGIIVQIKKVILAQ